MGMEGTGWLGIFLLFFKYNLIKQKDSILTPLFSLAHFDLGE